MKTAFRQVVFVAFALLVCLPSAGAQSGDLEEAAQFNVQVTNLYAARRFGEAIPLAQKALAIRERALGPEHPDTAESLNQLAMLYQATGGYTQAEPLFKRALAIREKAFGSEHSDTAEGLNNLATLYYATGEYVQAEPLFKRALAIREKALGPEHPDTAAILNNLAELYQATGTYARAELLLKRALAINEKALGPEHPMTATSLNNLARLYRATGAYAQAEPLFKRALAINEKTLGREHPDTVTSLNDLAGLYLVTGDYGQAEPLLKRALAINEKVLSPKHPGTVASLNRLAMLYQATGAYTQAEPLFKRALAIREKSLGPEAPATASSLNHLAMLYYATGAYAQAEPLLKRALAIDEKALGPEHPDTVKSLDNLAELYRTTGAYAQAEPLFKRAIAIRDKALGPKHKDTATTLDNLARLYYATGAYAQAEPLFKRALAIREKSLGPEHRDTATSLNNLAELYRTMGAYAQAESLFKRALAIDEKTLGPEHPDTATSLDNLAGLYVDTGAYAQAEPLFKRALAIDEKTLGPEHPDTATSLNDLARLYLVTGAYGQAEPLFKRALAINEKVLGPEHPDTASSLNNLAGLYRAMGGYAQAEPLYKRALAIDEKVRGPDHPKTAATLNNLAELYWTMGAYAQAEPLFKRALAINEKALGPEHPTTATSLNNLAELYRGIGAYAQAEPLYEHALAIRQDMVGSATSLDNLATLYQDMGAYAKAEPLRRHALAIYEQTLGLGHPNTAVSLNNLGELEWAEEHWPEAAAGFRRAAVASELVVQRIMGLGDESRKRAFAATLTRSSDTSVTFSLAARGRVADAVSLGLQVVLQRKGRVLDVMADSLGALTRSLAPQDQRVLEQWRATNAEYAALLFRGPGNKTPAQYRALLDQSKSKAESLEGVLSERSAEFRRQVQTVTVERVQQAIPNDSVLVEWFRYAPYNPKAAQENRPSRGMPRYMAYVLKRQGVPVAVDVGDARPIDTAISDLLATLRDRHSSLVTALARDLDARLMRPLRPYIGDAERIVLSPDGQLNLLPFGVLIDADGRYLIQSADLTYVTSGRDLLRVASTARSRQPPVIVADPDYGPLHQVMDQDATDASHRRSADMRAGRLEFKPLPGTAAEAKAIQRILKLQDQQVLTQRNATEKALKQFAGPRILHLATHGFFLADQAADTGDTRPPPLGKDRAQVSTGENPLLRSGLALAGANQLHSGQEDGILTALEAAGLDLAGTELAVLSACETGVGEVQNGEGVYGLRRALVLAGVQTQVTSLWKIDDAATRDLMVDYYGRLSAGMGRSAALRAAQLAMLTDSAHPERRHPYYWASFITIGDGAPLQP